MLYICDKTFEKRERMMSHRKAEHKNFVRICMNFSQNNCRFEDSSCWFLHDEKIETEEYADNENEENEEDKIESELDFQQVSRNKKPPIGKQKKQKTD